ncbi:MULTISPECIES: NUDIX domain-containing protein [Kribbella]|uniref:Nudix hydrolase domain-containing protein n=1 Tax=Kribbella karoonensis TaxID=324851 RepID=A0ABN2E5J5_9ACTN
MHSARHLTSLYLVRDRRVLLLYRRGSRAIPDSWVGIGGHLEPAELTDPTAAALRELHEELGITPEQLADLALRYVAVRDTGTEIRTTYYFTAELDAEAVVPAECSEGDLAWFDLVEDPRLDMPVTARVAFTHWLAVGRHDRKLRFVAVDAEGHEMGPA